MKINNLSDVIVTGSGINVSNGSGTLNISMNSDLVQFHGWNEQTQELILAALGIGVTYEQFCSMSIDERKSLIRDIKINRVLC
jgi:hypothetical protein